VFTLGVVIASPAVVDKISPPVPRTIEDESDVAAVLTS
jgi:hypothetical protein